jgi:hypothetical protein
MGSWEDKNKNQNTVVVPWPTIFQSSAEQNLYWRRISLKYWITKRNSELIEDCIKSESVISTSTYLLSKFVLVEITLLIRWWCLRAQACDEVQSQLAAQVRDSQQLPMKKGLLPTYIVSSYIFLLLTFDTYPLNIWVANYLGSSA